MDYYDYRDLYYFLQYQFYIRGEHHKKVLNKYKASLEDSLANNLEREPEFQEAAFLRELVENAAEVHYAWEVKNCEPQSQKLRVQIKRPPRGMRKAEAEGRLPVHSKNGSVLYFGDEIIFPKNSDQYMIFEVPKGHRDNQFVSMYKSLLIYDAVIRHGIDKAELIELVRKEKISELFGLRCLSLFEVIPLYDDTTKSKLASRYPAEKIIFQKLYGDRYFSKAGNPPALPGDLKSLTVPG